MAKFRSEASQTLSPVAQATLESVKKSKRGRPRKVQVQAPAEGAAKPQLPAAKPVAKPAKPDAGHTAKTVINGHRFGIMIGDSPKIKKAFTSQNEAIDYVRALPHHKACKAKLVTIHPLLVQTTIRIGGEVRPEMVPVPSERPFRPAPSPVKQAREDAKKAAASEPAEERVPEPDADASEEAEDDFLSEGPQDGE